MLKHVHTYIFSDHLQTMSLAKLKNGGKLESGCLWVKVGDSSQFHSFQVIQMKLATSCNASVRNALFVLC